MTDDELAALIDQLHRLQARGKELVEQQARLAKQVLAATKEAQRQCEWAISGKVQRPVT
jgi:radical SAM superfamily enzyme with C-terminal helix-hairpin-helix motif